jgi:hypothetical protein
MIGVFPSKLGASMQQYHGNQFQVDLPFLAIDPQFFWFLFRYGLMVLRSSCQLGGRRLVFSSSWCICGNVLHNSSNSLSSSKQDRLNASFKV